MRKLPAVLLGLLVLPVGLMPATAFAEVTPSTTASPTASPTATVSTAPTATATASSTPTASASATETSAPTATSTTATPTPTGSATPTPNPTDLDNVALGGFTMTPAHGKPGTVISLKSKDACADLKGVVGTQVEVVMLSKAELDAIDTIDSVTLDKMVTADAKGVWATTATVPAKAKTGDLYYLAAVCYPTGATIGDDTLPVMVYDAKQFTVTGADAAPVAEPVAGNPKFTG